MFLLESPEYLIHLFEDFSYIGPFVVLLLCGIGLPLPEEVTLIGAGILLHQEKVEFAPIAAVCALAILMGDSCPYFLGRRYGLSALKIRGIRTILHPERFARFKGRFERHGNWAVFLCRFFAGFRIPGYFVAGMMRMPYGRFLALDSLGVFLSVPISIWLGKLFGGQIERLEERVTDLNMILGFLVASLVVVLLVSGMRKPRRPTPTDTQGQARLPDEPDGTP